MVNHQTAMIPIYDGINVITREKIYSSELLGKSRNTIVTSYYQDDSGLYKAQQKIGCGIPFIDSIELWRKDINFDIEGYSKMEGIRLIGSRKQETLIRAVLDKPAHPIIPEFKKGYRPVLKEEGIEFISCDPLSEIIVKAENAKNCYIKLRS